MRPASIWKLLRHAAEKLEGMQAPTPKPTRLLGDPLTMEGGAGPTYQDAHPPWMNQRCVGWEGWEKHTNE